MMQAIGRRYVACFNARYRRTCTLWASRFKAALVDSDRHLLICYR
jgi:putative transposase